MLTTIPIRHGGVPKREREMFAYAPNSFQRKLGLKVLADESFRVCSQTHGHLQK